MGDSVSGVNKAMGIWTENVRDFYVQTKLESIGSETVSGPTRKIKWLWCLEAGALYVKKNSNILPLVNSIHYIAIGFSRILGIASLQSGINLRSTEV